jgi:probable phosphoglycerate mutase
VAAPIPMAQFTRYAALAAAKAMRVAGDPARVRLLLIAVDASPGPAATAGHGGGAQPRARSRLDGGMQTSPAQPARLLLTRHAQTPWNREYRYNSRTDVDVGDDAAEQLAPLAARLRGEGVERILVSTLVRARSTARILQEQGVAPGVVPEPRAELVELDFGGFEGVTRDELRGPVHGAAFAAWLTGDDGEPAAPGGGETWAEAAVRARAVLDDVEADPRTTLVVAHGYLLRVLYLTALGRSPALTRSLVWANGQLIELERDGSGWRERGA